MAYIYQIINDINNKVYVGKTEFSIEKRFQEHCNDAYKERCEKRPLYSAMRKYGIEHFHISLLEETDNPEERECYWIEQLRSFKNGYNATTGGDGKKYIDYDIVIATYNKTHNLNETARILGYDAHHISNILKNANILVLNRQEVCRQSLSKVIHQYSLSGQLLNSFSSTKEAARFLGDVKKSGHITQAANGKRKSAYGYKWSY